MDVRMRHLVELAAWQAVLRYVADAPVEDGSRPRSRHVLFPLAQPVILASVDAPRFLMAPLTTW